MTTYSTSLKLSLIADGDQAGTWGQTTNNNLGTLLEQAITGVVAITMLDANYTLSNLNGVSDEARNAVLVVGGTNTAQRDLIAPAVEKLYVVKNSTGQNLRIKTAGGTAVTIPNGVVMGVYCDGTDFYTSLNGTPGSLSVGTSLTVGTTAVLGGALTGTTATFSGAISSVSPSFTGTPTAPTAALGTNTTQIATTAFVQGSVGTLGTIASQNANNVNITGGSITGITDLAIADGGTGASTAANARANLDVPTRSGGDAAGTWGINITGNAATASNAIGVGQTWQNVAGSRSYGVTYTNSTGRAIQVAIALSGGSGGVFSYTFSINGSTVVSTTTDFGATLSYIIPSGNTYSVTSTDSLASWWELR